MSDVEAGIILRKAADELAENLSLKRSLTPVLHDESAFSPEQLAQIDQQIQSCVKQYEITQQACALPKPATINLPSRYNRTQAALICLGAMTPVLFSLNGPSGTLGAHNVAELLLSGALSAKLLMSIAWLQDGRASAMCNGLRMKAWAVLNQKRLQSVMKPNFWDRLRSHGVDVPRTNPEAWLKNLTTSQPLAGKYFESERALDQGHRQLTQVKDRYLSKGSIDNAELHADLLALEREWEQLPALFGGPQKRRTPEQIEASVNSLQVRATQLQRILARHNISESNYIEIGVDKLLPHVVPEVFLNSELTRNRNFWSEKTFRVDPEHRASTLKFFDVAADAEPLMELQDDLEDLMRRGGNIEVSVVPRASDLAPNATLGTAGVGQLDITMRQVGVENAQTKTFQIRFKTRESNPENYLIADRAEWIPRLREQIEGGAPHVPAARGLIPACRQTLRSALQNLRGIAP